MRVIEFARGHIKLAHGDKTLTILGEALLPGYGSPDFVLYLNSLDAWDAAAGGATLSEEEREEALNTVRAYFAEKKMKVEFE